MNSRWHKRFIGLLILLLVIGMAVPIPMSADSLNQVTDAEVNALFARLTVQQRIGQLIMVTFKGSFLNNDTPAARLIRDYRIGGVLLLAHNDNIDARESAPANLQRLTNQLQQMAFDATLNPAGRSAESYVPLFIATMHEGSTIPGTQLITGMTQLPSNLALGATWRPEHAKRVGSIAGRELAALGINLLFSPSLDVLPTIISDNTDTTRSFGGEPFWVGNMAQWYIQGVHEGSDNRVLVVPRNFPGLGSSDRKPELEIPVVPRTIDELQRIDLIPYIAVTGNADSEAETADGMQCANVRYQGENIRAVTRPTCIDEQALGDLLRLQGIRDWQEKGGVIFSDGLGTQALRRWYEADQFPHRQVAREALLAGNDVLLLSDFGQNPSDDDFDNIRDVIEFFTSMYRNDPVVRTRIDQSVRRILRQKLKAYGAQISLEKTLRSQGALVGVGQSTAEIYQIARDAVTLVAPARQRLLPPPGVSDRIAIFTDVRYTQQCSYCPVHPTIPVDAFGSALIRLYGPQASGQVIPDNINSYTFARLNDYLDDPLMGDPPESIDSDTVRLRDGLENANWIVFATIDASPEVPGGALIKKFLEMRPDLANRARVVVIAFGAPTYLSSTDISKLAAYYAVYSSTIPFVDAAARAFFQEISSYRGNLPMSVPALSYDIFRVTSPSPSQIIRIVPEFSKIPDIQTPALLPTTTVGDTLLLRTEPILDHNGHVVPDDTPVVFTLSFVTEGVQRQQDSTTKDGIARTSFVLSRPGQIQITADSGEARTSITFQITVTDIAAVATLQTIEPPPIQLTLSSIPTLTSTSTLTPSPSATLLPSETPSPTYTATPPIIAATTRQVGPRDFVGAFIGLMLLAVGGFTVRWATSHSVNAGLRLALATAVGGLIGYIYYAVKLPGADVLHTAIPEYGALLSTLVIGIAGLLTGWISVRKLTGTFY